MRDVYPLADRTITTCVNCGIEADVHSCLPEEVTKKLKAEGWQTIAIMNHVDKGDDVYHDVCPRCTDTVFPKKEKRWYE